jgi:hypothetical protein
MTIANLKKVMKVANTPQRNESLNGLVKDAIKIALYTMKYGSMSDKMALMKTLTPHMLEALRQTQSSEADEETKKAYNRMRAQMRGEPDPTDLSRGSPK